MVSSTAGRIDALFASWDDPASPGAVLGVIQDGQLVYARRYGMASLEHSRPITPKTGGFTMSTQRSMGMKFGKKRAG
jgi:CubicO group peptidase (beta-lactamase class C family)